MSQIHSAARTLTARPATVRTQQRAPAPAYRSHIRFGGHHLDAVLQFSADREAALRLLQQAAPGDRAAEHVAACSWAVQTRVFGGGGRKAERTDARCPGSEALINARLSLARPFARPGQLSPPRPSLVASIGRAVLHAPGQSFALQWPAGMFACWTEPKAGGRSIGKVAHNRIASRHSFRPAGVQRAPLFIGSKELLP